jgi:hypothetical protein
MDGLPVIAAAADHLRSDPHDIAEMATLWVPSPVTRSGPNRSYSSRHDRDRPKSQVWTTKATGLKRFRARSPLEGIVVSDVQPEPVVIEESSPERRRQTATEIRRLQALLDDDAAHISRLTKQFAVLLAVALAAGATWLCRTLFVF